MINDAYDGEDNGGYYTVGGIELYPNGCQPVLDYNVEVYDLGVLNENNAEKLSAFDRIYLVGGISWNEFPLTYQSQTLIGQYNYTILINFCDNERLNAPIQIDGGSMDAAMSTPKGGKDAAQPSVDGSNSSYGRLLNEVNMQNVLSLPFAPDAFGAEVFEMHCSASKRCIPAIKLLSYPLKKLIPFGILPFVGGTFVTYLPGCRFVNDFVHDSQKEIQWEITSQEGA